MYHFLVQKQNKTVRFALLFSTVNFTSFFSDIYLWFMAIHIGKKIKEEMRKQNISVSVFAEKINRSRNVVYDIFGRESIDTDLLNKISKILNCDFFSLYSSQKEYLSDTIKHFYVSESSVPYGKHSEQIISLQQQTQVLINEINYLKKIITLLESKKDIKTKKKS